MGTPSEEELNELLECTNFTEKEIKGFYKFGPGNRVGRADFLKLCAANGLVATVCTLSLALSLARARAASLARSVMGTRAHTAFFGDYRGSPRGCGIYSMRTTTGRAQTLS